MADYSSRSNDLYVYVGDDHYLPPDEERPSMIIKLDSNYSELDKFQEEVIKGVMELANYRELHIEIERKEMSDGDIYLDFYVQNKDGEWIPYFTSAIIKQSITIE